jgi:hypothetical protein
MGDVEAESMGDALVDGVGGAGVHERLQLFPLDLDAKMDVMTSRDPRQRVQRYADFLRDVFVLWRSVVQGQAENAAPRRTLVNRENFSGQK